MQSVGTKDTGPERMVRRLLHAAGFRYRLHAKNLPGRPDIVFPGRMKAIFVNGCFWHNHGCAKGQVPKSRLDYWGPKLEANRARDALNKRRLRAMGWRVMTVWQSQTRKPERLAAKTIAFLNE
jgi:DNA mismatch endonuclease (patch repair protein)